MTASQSLLGQAETAERKRDYPRARALYQQAKATATGAPERAQAGRRFALALAFWGEYRGAAKELAEVVVQDPTDVRSWHDLGILRHRLKDPAGAETALRRAVALRPGEPRTRIALAALLASQRRFADAITEYRALLRLDLPDRIRTKVQWAVRALAREAPRGSPSPQPTSP